MANILNAGVDGIVLTASSSAALNIQVGGTSALLLGALGQFGIGGANYGTSGQVLTSNGSGSAPSWQTIGGGSLKSQEFLASGTFTVPTGITSVWVTMIGGGGSGAAGTGGRGGGGAGAYCFKRPFSVTAGASLTVTIGGGGAGVLAAATGNPGTSTSFSSLTVTGGSGGGVSTSTQNPVLAGAGGSAGATGTEGGVAEGSLLGGRGGQSLYNGTAYIGGGGGGFGDGTAASTTTLGNSANAATNSGAGSGAQAAAAAASSSGNGGSGRVIIEWFA
jgi:hypothetical protein